MFLSKMMEVNQRLLDVALQFHQAGDILPDTYVIDLDTLKENARKILAQANQQHIDLYFMTKQVGRNPFIARELIKMGYRGAVVVDFREAAVMMKHHIPIANVGHLVQTPKAMLQELVAYGCEYMTVFSYEKICEINACAKKVGKVQKLLLKVVGEQDMIYSGQTAGFHLYELETLVHRIRELDNIEIKGVTSFPCFLYDEDSEKLNPTPNLTTLFEAEKKLKEFGIVIDNMNAPSTTSVETLKQMINYSIQSGEPGHGLTGSTPFHAHHACVEIPCVVYVSEISHNFGQKAYCYGGGHYRRSHMKHALVGHCPQQLKKIEVHPPTLDSIDYYFELSEECAINDTVLMAFRFQIFVTRSHVCLVEGLHTNQPNIIGLYNSQGDSIHA